MTLIPTYEIDRTDLTRWRLKVDHGRQTWHYLESEEEIRNYPQSIIEKYWLGLPFETEKFGLPTSALESARNGFEFFKKLQTEDGHWAGEYGGPMFLLPGLIIAMYITKIPIPESWRLEIIRYLFNKAHPVDGGWGLHIEHHSTVFGTALNYVTLRILGVDADHPLMVKARGTLHKLGGAAGAPSWGKFWLANLNVYDWEGINPIPPEFWLLPYSLPIHPGRFWIHTRVVYLPMGYIYGRRLSAEKIPNFLGLREVSIQESYALIQCEDENTDYLDIAPVGLADDPAYHESMIRALEFLDYSQFKNDPIYMDRCYRGKTKGAWGFSTRNQGYVVSDCTALGMSAVLGLQEKLR
ncbi:1405_t:CDS:2 [Acaulospora colombiana]|uniref:1405_t:CDS:1 n=1 Tax=Acaulospora colombiana TaxID=27376 RepID=A0ACA9JZU6_9GLOM|nr:1405_t:CDS:2 [Acaulospora colombiana]